MKAGSFAVFAPALLLASAAARPARRQPPPHAAATPPHGSAAARAGGAQRAESVRGASPRSARSVSITRRIGSISASQPVSCAAAVIVPPGAYFPGPYYYPGYSRTTGLRDVDGGDVPACRWRKPICDASAKPSRGASRAADRARHGAGLRRWILRRARRGIRTAWTSDRHLDAGAHHVELRAPGYETLTFSVMIEPNDIVRYRGDMQRDRDEAGVPSSRRRGRRTAVAQKLLRDSQLLRRRQAARQARCPRAATSKNLRRGTDRLSELGRSSARSAITLAACTRTAHCPRRSRRAACRSRRSSSGPSGRPSRAASSTAGCPFARRARRSTLRRFR